MKALIIVDVQNDFLPGGSLATKQGDEVIPVINTLQEAFSCVLATKDWHPPHHISFASSHGKKPGEVIQIEGLKQELWPDHCVQGTFGAEFSPALDTDRVRKVFFKGADSRVDSYSTFYDNAHLRSTGLDTYLRDLGVNEIYLVGLATDYCIKYSALDARKIGLKVHVVLDGCRGVDLKPGDVERAIVEMKDIGADITTSDQILAPTSQN